MYSLVVRARVKGIVSRGKRSACFFEITIYSNSENFLVTLFRKLVPISGSRASDSKS
jgi:hypothetical protein